MRHSDLFKGPFQKGPIHYGFAIYYLPVPEHPPEEVLKALLDGEFKQWRLVTSGEPNPEEMTISARSINPSASYAPPSVESLRYFGRGISKEQADALQKTEAAFILDFQYGKEHVLDGMQAACALHERLARATGGVIWDEETREGFSADEWHKRRLSSWKNDLPDISQQVAIHAYKKETFVRAITLGMAKFGLPDIAVEDFSWDSSRTMGILVAIFGQAMLEGAGADSPESFTLDLKKIRHDDVRERQLTTLKKHATAKVQLVLRSGKWEEGDPRNRLVKLGFDHYEGPDLHARQQKLLEDFLGWSDSISTVQPNKELRDASERARAKLPKLRADFVSGLAPGESILVKAPFRAPDNGEEYMWVEVSKWKDSKIGGLLRSEPYKVKTLHAGQIVEVLEAEVYDYIRQFPDGSREGNETGKIIQAQQGPQVTQ
jgi:uncharacterized protein YegJ (DUF2314 family)